MSTLTKEDRKIKNSLEHELPYYKITTAAERRFDAILNGLPDLAAAPETEDKTEYKPAHLAEVSKGKRFKKEENIIEPQFDAPPKKRRWWGIATAACAAVIFGFFSITILRYGALNYPKNKLPVLHEPMSASRADVLKPYDLKITDVSAYGRYITFELELSTDREELKNAAWLTAQWRGNGGITVTVDGKEAKVYVQPVFRKENGIFKSCLTVLANDSIKEKEEKNKEVAAVISIPELYGMTSEDAIVSEPDIKVINAVETEQTVALNDVVTRVPEIDGAVGMNDVYLSNFEDSDSGFSFLLNYPAVINELGGNVFTRVTTQYDWPLVCMNGGMYYHTEAETDTALWSFVYEPIPEGTTYLTVQVLSNPVTDGAANGISAQLLAEFKVDVENGYKVTPSYTYKADFKELADIADLAGYSRLGLKYTRNIAPTCMVSGSREDETDSSETRREMMFGILSNIPNELPLKVEFFSDDGNVITIPLQVTEEWEQREDGARVYYGADESNGEIAYRVESVRYTDAFWDIYKANEAYEELRRSWDIVVYLPPSRYGDGENGQWYARVCDIETGETVVEVPQREVYFTDLAEAEEYLFHGGSLTETLPDAIEDEQE